MQLHTAGGGIAAPRARLVKTQCSCSSGFSSELRAWIGSSLKYDCSLVTRESVRFYIQSFLKITTWTRSSALIGPEGTLLVFLFQAPFTKIDMHRSGIRPASDRHGRDAHHTRTRHPQIQLRSCSPSALWLIFLRCAPLCTNRRLLSTLFDQQTGSRGSNIYIQMASVPREVVPKKRTADSVSSFPACLDECTGTCWKHYITLAHPPDHHCI